MNESLPLVPSNCTLFTSKCYILYQILFSQYGEYTLYMQDIGAKLIPTWQFDTYINNTQ